MSLETEVSLDTQCGGRVLDKGQHVFAFAIVVPSTTAPYERCPYGRVRHRLQAIAKGAGLAGGDITAEAGIDIVVNPADEGDLMALNMISQGFHPEVGPYAVALKSQHLTPGGLVHFDLNLASIPESIDIQAVSVHIDQSYRLSSLKNTGDEVIPSSHKRHLFTLDSVTKNRPSSSYGRNGTASPHRRSSRSPKDKAAELVAPQGFLATVSKGASYEIVDHVTRMPDDDLLRGTTQKGSKTGIRVSHEAIVEVRFRRVSPEGKLRVFRTAQPITLSSCCCMLESLLLPSYSEQDPLARKGSRRRVRNCSVACVCGQTLQSLIDEQGKQVDETALEQFIPPKPAPVHSGSQVSG